MRFLCCCLIAIGPLGALSGAAYGQSLAGLSAINGTVRDASGAVVPEAAVTVSNPNIGLARRQRTNAAGYFFAPSLAPGPGYVVSVEKEGFAVYEARDIVLQVGQNVTVNVELTVSRQAQTITVTEATPVVEQSKTGVSDIVDSSQILNLPINGRRVDTFVLLTPGVTEDGTFGVVSFRGVPSGNAFLQDGNDTTQQFYNENAGRTRIGSNISQDAVQEFQVQTSGYSAEFGRAVGGVINTVTRSGTNEIHGTAYWFFRNQALNARDRYASFNPEESRHQAGGSIGGPLRKDRLFYFFNGELMRRDFPLLSSIVNPQFFAGGNFIGNCGAPATAQQCQAVANYLQRYFGVVERTVSQNLAFGKIDWRPGERHNLTANFNLLNFESPNGIQTGAVLTNAAAFGNNGLSTVRNRWARLSHTGIVSASAVNEFRFGWFKDRQADFVNDALAPPYALRSALTVQGQSNLGVPNYLPRVQPTEDRFQFADNLSWTRGRHQFKFGLDIAHTRDVEEALFNGTGSYTYGTITDFARDLTNLDGGKRWQSYSQAFGLRLTKIHVRDFNFYAQDQWRVGRGLTLNYGLRYELARFAQPEKFNPDYPQTGVIHEPAANFAPRLGIAYSFNRDRTVLRAGYGIFYARLPAATIARLHQLNGVQQKSITLQSNVASDLAAGPVFPARLQDIDRNPPAGTVNISFADANLATPYTQQGDIGLEQQITRNMGITISYLWSRGLKFLTRRDLNIGPPGGEFTYRILDAAGNPAGTYTTPVYVTANRVDRRYSRVTLIDNGGRLWYDGMTVQFRRRAARWAQMTLAYTWAHARDLNQGGGTSNTFYTDAPATLFNGDYSAEKGSSVLDQRHRLVVTAVARLPRRRYGSRAADGVLNGWQLSLISTAASAKSFDPGMQVSGAQYPGQAFTSTLNGFGGSARVPFLPRSSVNVDQIYRTDARLTKIVKLNERFELYANFETFNTFNRVSNTAVITASYSARSGVITPLAGVGTGTASAGFPDGTNARRAQVSLRLRF